MKVHRHGHAAIHIRNTFQPERRFFREKSQGAGKCLLRRGQKALLWPTMKRTGSAENGRISSSRATVRRSLQNGLLCSMAAERRFTSPLAHSVGWGRL